MISDQEYIDLACIIDEDKIYIFLDINMPVMDGWQFLEHFVQIGGSLKKEVTLYIVSSSINPKDIEKANKLESISGYIIKPVKPKDLEVLFRKVPQ